MNQNAVVTHYYPADLRKKKKNKEKKRRVLKLESKMINERNICRAV